MDFHSGPRPSRDPLEGALLACLAFPWVVHAVVVAGSAAGGRPLGSRWAPILTLLSGLVAAVTVPAVFGGERPALDGSLAPPLPRALCRGLTGVGLLSVGIVLLSGILLPVTAYDALAYRLPTMATWLDDGRIAWVFADDPVRNGYPLGQEAISAVVAAALGTVRGFGATSTVFVLSGALSVWLLAERCGVRRGFARAAGSLVLLCPMTILNAPSGYSDAAFGGATVALACGVALVSIRPTRGHLLAAGMAASHVLSLKGTGVAFALVAGVAALPGLVRAPRAGVALLVAAVLPGTFWALRNVLHTGNPFYPVQLRLPGWTLSGIGPLEKVLDVEHNTPPELRPFGALGRVLRTWFEWRGPARDFDDRLGGLGWAWPFAALPSLLHLGARARAERAELRPALVATALVAVFFVLQPMNWWARYTVWLWGAGALAIALSAERLARSGRSRILGAALAGLAVVSPGEAAYAAAHANGLGRALSRGSTLAGLGDVRRGANAEHWVEPAFFDLGIAAHPEICRGAWKPGTDNANLDGVFAQLAPRPRVHVVLDDRRDWTSVRREWARTSCKRLLLLQGSPVLVAALRDPEVRVAPAVAFDPLYVVRFEPEAAVSLRTERP